MANEEQLIRVVPETFVNFDRLTPGTMPRLVRSSLDGVYMWPFNGAVVWLREDQLSEVASLMELAIRERDDRLRGENAESRAAQR